MQSSLLRSTLATSQSVAPALLRVALGVMMFPHGAQKLLGWFGGFGFQASLGYFTGTVGVPSVIGVLVILGEFFGSLMLIFGAGTRFAAASMAVIIAGAAYQLRGNGFFMNWFGNQKGEGIELFILAIGIALSLVITGAGKYSVDGAAAR